MKLPALYAVRLTKPDGRRARGHSLNCAAVGGNCIDLPSINNTLVADAFEEADAPCDALVYYSGGELVATHYVAAIASFALLLDFLDTDAIAPDDHTFATPISSRFATFGDTKEIT